MKIGMMRKRNVFVRGAYVAFASLVFGLQLSPAQAEMKSASSEYKILVHGFTLAKMNFNTRWDDENYIIDGKIKSSALADIVAKTRGETKVVGKIADKHLQATEYKIDYTTGDERRALSVVYDQNGKVTTSSISPTPKKMPSDWVDVKKEHLLSVVDPISAMTFPYRSPNEPVCDRTVSIFDGETALDLKLSFKSHKRFNTKGFKGRVVACRVTFHPKGGYRADHDSIKYLQQSKGMEVWLGLSKTINAYVPVFAKIPTKVGDVRVWATRINVGS